MKREALDIEREMAEAWPPIFGPTGSPIVEHNVTVKVLVDTWRLGPPVRPERNIPGYEDDAGRWVPARVLSDAEMRVAERIYWRSVAEYERTRGVHQMERGRIYTLRARCIDGTNAVAEGDGNGRWTWREYRTP
jgi:hypothetical protein